MSTNRNVLKDMSDESIIGITDLVSGEKDPRNLMVIFSILKVVMIEWDISNQAEVIPLAVESFAELSDSQPDPVRFCVLLLPYHLSTSSRRSLWDYSTRPQESPQGVHLCIESFCTFRVSSDD